MAHVPPLPTSGRDRTENVVSQDHPCLPALYKCLLGSRISDMHLTCILQLDSLLQNQTFRSPQSCARYHQQKVKTVLSDMRVFPTVTSRMMGWEGLVGYGVSTAASNGAYNDPTIQSFSNTPADWMCNLLVDYSRSPSLHPESHRTTIIHSTCIPTLFITQYAGTEYCIGRTNRPGNNPARPGQAMRIAAEAL